MFADKIVECYALYSGELHYWKTLLNLCQPERAGWHSVKCGA